MNPFKKLKLKSKLHNCDYKLAGTVIKQQYYNENSHTEINRMIDHFMEEPCFERALDLIEYNEMIVFYFTESCTDGLYVRKSPNIVESTKDSDLVAAIPYEQAPAFATPPAIHEANHTEEFNEQSSDSSRKDAHTENLQKIQESEEWMDQMISRLAKKPKLPIESQTPIIPVRDLTSTIVTPSAKIYDDEEAESFDTIEFKSSDVIRDITIFEEREISTAEIEPIQSIEVFYESELPPEPQKEKKEIEVFYETEVFQEPEIVQHEPTVFYESEVFHEPEVYQKTEVFYETEVFQEPEPIREKEAFEFVASAASKHLDNTDPTLLFASPPSAASDSEPERIKRQSFPNVAATLKIDLHTMMKQLDEYRYQLAYKPHNQQQLISWIESLEKAVDEFSSALDIIEDVYE